ncbi:MAG: hypothetical protein K6F58_02585 [Bacteroidales bacterium]|nr:hypothetical protein [Bacteroidales bacterium]
MKKFLFFLLLCCLQWLPAGAAEVTDEWSNLSFSFPDTWTVSKTEQLGNGRRFVLVNPAGGHMSLYVLNANRKNEMEVDNQQKYYKRSKIKEMDAAFWNLKNPVYVDKPGFLALGQTEWEYHYLQKEGDSVPTICTRYYWRESQLVIFFIEDRNGDFQPYKDVIASSSIVDWPPLEKLFSITTNDFASWALILIYVLALVVVWGSFVSSEKITWEDAAAFLFALLLLGIVVFIVRPDRELMLFTGGWGLGILALIALYGLIKHLFKKES